MNGALGFASQSPLLQRVSPQEADRAAGLLDSGSLLFSIVTDNAARRSVNQVSLVMPPVLSAIAGWYHLRDQKCVARTLCPAEEEEIVGASSRARMSRAEILKCLLANCPLRYATARDRIYAGLIECVAATVTVHDEELI